MVSLRPNYFMFIGYLKTGDTERGSSEPPEPPLDPPLLKISDKIVPSGAFLLVPLRIYA